MMSPKAIILLAVALLGSDALLQGCGGGGDATTTTTTPSVPPTSGSTIPDLAGKTPTLSMLVAALQAADLVSTLEGTGPFTVFAPTNDAFLALPFKGAELTYLYNNKDKLTEVLEYHVASGNVTSGELKNGEKIKMLMGGSVTVKCQDQLTAHGEKCIEITVMINDAKLSRTTPDMKASNGVVHIIDKVLIPENFTAPNIPELAQSANLTTLVAALTAANLVAAVSGGPLTVFAPTNAAFAALPAGVLDKLLEPANIASLQQVLKYHVHSPGEIDAENLKLLSYGQPYGQPVTTLEGSKLNITIADSKLQVNSANVIKADVFAVNGVVHVIDAVLLPPDFVPPTSKRSASILV